MKVALVTVHASATFIPLSLLYLKAVLVERHGRARESIDILEFPKGTAADAIIERVLATGADVLGLSCYVWNVEVLMAAAAQLKVLRPALTVVLGGPEVGPVGRDVLERHPSVDVVVRSEGEQPFPAILDRLESGASLADVPGIYYRVEQEARSEERILDTGDAPILRDLNELPSPHLGGYVDATDRRIVCIETQRGCVFRCNFCFYNKDLSIRNRRFDLDRVKAEILYWLERDVREIFLMDPVFNLNAERTKEICRFIAEHNTRQVPFHAEIWAEFVDQEAARLFREANIQFLEVGLQTTDDGVLATVERRLKMQKFMDGIDYLKREGLPFELQLIYGLPGETRASFRKSLNFAASLEPPFLAVFPLMVLPGTELWNKAEALRIEFSDKPPYFVERHMTMSADDMAYGHRVSDAVVHLQTARSIQLLSREPGMSMADLVDEWIEWQGQSNSDLPRFVDHVCASRRIQPEFYRAFALAEISQ